MKKQYFTIVFIFLVFTIYSQNVKLQIITKQNDTIKDFVLKRNYDFENSMVLALQEKLVVFDVNGVKKEFIPSDLKSFSFINNNKLVEFVNVEDKAFGLLMYSNKLKLLKVIKPGYTTVNIYVIVRPNMKKNSFMEAMGLSRLISKKVITREITDCPTVIEKVEKNELKINGEEGVIELVKDYESSCF